MSKEGVVRLRVLPRTTSCLGIERLLLTIAPERENTEGGNSLERRLRNWATLKAQSY